jgi:hypothetical protein
MGTTKLKFAFSVVAIAAALAAAMPGASAQNMAVEEFFANAININNRATAPGRTRPTTAQLTVRIERWSTDKERDDLLAIIKGTPDVNRMNQALLRAIQRLPRVGRIRESQSVGWDLRYARQNPLDEGGRQIIVATDRPIGFWEASNRPRTIDYPFTILEMRLDKDNRGEGKMIADTRIMVNQKTSELVLENFDISPVRLANIRRTN